MWWQAIAVSAVLPGGDLVPLVHAVKETCAHTVCWPASLPGKTDDRRSVQVGGRPLRLEQKTIGHQAPRGRRIIEWTVDAAREVATIGVGPSRSPGERADRDMGEVGVKAKLTNAQ